MNPESVAAKIGVVRIVEPGLFDYQSKDYLVRMRAWGVTFPNRGQPGFEEAIAFTEEQLLDRNLTIELRAEFDRQNLKVVDIFTGPEKVNFSRECIENGMGWHNEVESMRNGAYAIAQLKAKRRELGIWKYGNSYQVLPHDKDIPTPLLRSMIEQNPFSSSLNYWVTTFGKIHRPGCSFYERGRGSLSRRPVGDNCRICGGTNPKRD
ncbi:MAG: thermonuclease family protein [Opitutae bacterium]